MQVTMPTVMFPLHVYSMVTLCTHCSHTSRRMVAPNVTDTFPGMNRLRGSQITCSLSRYMWGVFFSCHGEHT